MTDLSQTNNKHGFETYNIEPEEFYFDQKDVQKHQITI